MTEGRVIETACSCGIKWAAPSTEHGLLELSRQVGRHTLDNPTHTAGVDLGDDH